MKAELASLSNEIKKWVEVSRERVAKAYNASNFPHLDRFEDRTVDVAEPIASIVEVAYAGHVNLAKTRVVISIAISKTRKDNAGLGDDLRIIEGLRNQAADHDPLVGTATELADMFGAGDVTAISNALRRSGFVTKSRRLPGGGLPKHRYSVTRAELDEIWQQNYGPDTIEEGGAV